MILKVILLFAYAVFCEVLEEGEKCYKKGVEGVCIQLGQCKTAIGELQNRTLPQICSFDNNNLPVVCCTDKQDVSPPPPPHASDADDGCEPLDPSVSPPKTGQKAFDKCIEYQVKYVYPCEPGVSLLGEPSRSNKCYHETDELIIGGTDAAQYEFPHMVMIGFGEEIEDVQYRCGGALITDRFILTAGHCSASRDIGPITYVVVGALRRGDAADRSKIYKVKNIIKHPEYQPPSKYNDIALVETENLIKLNQFVVPACLHTGDPVNDDKVQATGWGLTAYRGATSEVLQKVVLDKFSVGECSHYIQKNIQKYGNMRLMKHGFDNSTQTCYGDKGAPPLNEGKLESKDTCRGDSGGPIQIKSKKIHCMYTVVGVTSVGKYCGFADTPGLYTRVAPYVPWIESIVWPN